MLSPYKYIFLILLLTAAFAACYKDKGNYDIKPVDEIRIGGVAYSPENYTLQQFDTLRITPEFTYTGNASDLSFTWRLFPSSAKMGDTTVKIVSNSRDLEYRVRVPIGSYTVHLEIKDTRTSILRSKTFGMNVRVKASQGFMVLNTKANGDQDIDVILDNTKPDIISGVFSANNSIVLRNAVGLDMLQSFANPNGLVYIMQKEGGYTLLPSFGLLQEAKYWFFDAPARIAPTAISTDMFGMNTYLVSNGSLHSTLTNNPPALFSFRASGNYKATASLFMGTSAFIYDDLNHRFLRFNKTAGAMNTFIVNPEDKFDVNNIGNKSCFLFDHNMAAGTAPGAANFNSLKPIAYCRDNSTAKVFAYKFGYYRSLATYCESIKEVTAPGFAEATAYVNAANNPLTYFAYGNKIFAYDLANDAARLVYTFADENVRIDKLQTNGAQLLAIVNGKTANAGSVYFFKVLGTGSFENDTYFSRYDGFGKIQDVQYKSNTVSTAPAWK